MKGRYSTVASTLSETIEFDVPHGIQSFKDWSRLVLHLAARMYRKEEEREREKRKEMDRLILILLRRKWTWKAKRFFGGYLG